MVTFVSNYIGRPNLKSVFSNFIFEIIGTV